MNYLEKLSARFSPRSTRRSNGGMTLTKSPTLI